MDTLTAPVAHSIATRIASFKANKLKKDHLLRAYAEIKKKANNGFFATKIDFSPIKGNCGLYHTEVPICEEAGEILESQGFKLTNRKDCLSPYSSSTEISWVELAQDSPTLVMNIILNDCPMEDIK